MINTKSDHLVILMGTLNRLDALRGVVDSILNGTRASMELIVIDAGSTDGTVDYLREHPGITAVFQGSRIGHARSHNEVWRRVESRYTGWLSDDTELVPGSLDQALAILDDDPTIGMVGLKMKDTLGPGQHDAYMGGLSYYGILNCNHGVLRTPLMRQVGFFNESYRMYMLDPDLTASVLSTGHRVVMTKRISILHHRAWSATDDPGKVARDMGGIDNAKVYRQKFAFLEPSRTMLARMRAKVVHYTAKALFLGAKPGAARFWLNRRDWVNLAGGRFISLLDPIRHRHRPYHLAQTIPAALLDSTANPYRQVVHAARGGQHPAPGAVQQADS